MQGSLITTISVTISIVLLALRELLDASPLESAKRIARYSTMAVIASVGVASAALVSQVVAG